jgi:hypothetical protein
VNDVVKIALVVVSTLLGTLFSLWKSGGVRGWISALVLLSISALLAFTDDALLSGPPLVAWLALGVGLAFGLSYPCCVPTPRIGIYQVIGLAAVTVHCLLDGHIVREATNLALIILLCVHKFLDGADGRILSRDNRASTMVARIVLVLATPIGFLAIPGDAVAPALHASLFAGIIGLNVGTAIHILRHEAHERRALQVSKVG